MHGACNVPNLIIIFQAQQNKILDYLSNYSVWNWSKMNDYKPYQSFLKQGLSFKTFLTNAITELSNSSVRYTVLACDQQFLYTCVLKLETDLNYGNGKKKVTFKQRT
jgi:hypothetical protein